MSNRISSHYSETGQKDHKGKNDKPIHTLET